MAERRGDENHEPGEEKRPTAVPVARLADRGLEEHVGDDPGGELDREQGPALSEPAVDRGRQRFEQRETDRHEQRGHADREHRIEQSAAPGVEHSYREIVGRGCLRPLGVGDEGGNEPEAHGRTQPGQQEHRAEPAEIDDVSRH